MKIAGRVSDTKSNEEAGRPLQSDCISAAPAVPGLRRCSGESGRDLHLARLDIEVCVDHFVALSTASAPAGVG